MQAAIVPRSPGLPFSRLLLTGGNGFVGTHLAPMLSAAAPSQTRLMLARPGSPAPGGDWAVAEAEIDDRESVAAIVRDFAPDCILHLAAQASVGASQAQAEATWRVNFDGTFTLAAACARLAPRATFLFTSSGETYGASFRDGEASEDTPLRPQNAYARSKAAAEEMLRDILGPENRLIVTRAFNHTGRGQDERFVLPAFAAQIARIERGAQPPVMTVGNLEAVRDFLDVRDVCAAYLALLARAPSLKMRSVFNVSSGTGWRIADLLALLKAQAGAPFEIQPDAARLRPSDIPVAIGRSDLLREVAGWRPAHPIEETLRDVLAHARQAAARADR